MKATFCNKTGALAALERRFWAVAAAAEAEWKKLSASSFGDDAAACNHRRLARRLQGLERALWLEEGGAR